MSPEVPVLIVTVDKTTSLEVMAHEAGVLAVFSKMEFLEACDLLRTFLTRAA
jgi:hypothetical protein